MLNADPLYWWEYLRGIDFHQRVNIKRLPKHTRLVRYDFADPGPRRELPPFAFFTDAGSSPFHTGTSWPAYFYKEYNVVDETLALVSIASTISWLPTRKRGDSIACTGRAAPCSTSSAGLIHRSCCTSVSGVRSERVVNAYCVACSCQSKSTLKGS